MITPGSTNAAVFGGANQYRASRSLRLRASASAALTRTPTAAGDRTKWTLNGWYKRGVLGAGTQMILGARDAGTTIFQYLGFNGDTLDISDRSGARKSTNAVFRDPAAWYPITITVDTNQAVATDRIRMFVGPFQITSFSTDTAPALGGSMDINSAVMHAIGQYGANAGSFYDGLIAEMTFVDGQALLPTAFGEIEAVAGVWVPKKYAGTYGANGFYLNFGDNSAATATAIGKDSSPNGNNWTPTGISVTAGATNDSLIDSPTNYDDGGTGRGNYAALNPLSKQSTINLTNANLTVTSSGHGTVSSTIAMVAGKWYAEFNWTAWAGAGGLGFTANQMEQSGASAVAGKYWTYDNSGSFNLFQGATNVALGGGRMATGQTWHAAYDCATGNAWLGFNGQWLDSGGTYTGNPATGANPTFTMSSFVGTSVFFMVEGGGSGTMDVNFGQRPFGYAPPSGFKALNTQNLPDPAIKKPSLYFDVTAYAGNGAVQNVVNSSGMQPDLVAYKDRSVARDWGWFDAVRGAAAYIASNLTTAESASGAFTSFNSNGFTLPNSTNSNSAGEAYVAYQWKRGVLPGFDIVTYTGDGTSNTRTIPHALGAVPALIISKARSAASEWPMYHKGLPVTWTAYINAQYAANTYASRYDPAGFTASVFKLGTNSENNVNGVTQVAYLWSEVPAFSKFGVFTGNASTDGPFVNCGFKPKFILTKRADSSNDWLLHDSVRSPSNVSSLEMYLHLANVEGSVVRFDILSNGFKVRDNGVNVNASGGTYLYIAFAENPFKYARAR